MAIFESTIGELGSIGLMGGGMLLGVLGLVIASVRGTTKNKDMWALGFSTLAILISLAIPNAIFASGIFIMGAIALTMAFTPIIQGEKGRGVDDANIFVIAVIAGLINILLMVSFNAYASSLTWQDNLDGVRNDIASILGTEVNSFENGIPQNGLCKPNDQECTNSWISGAFNPLIFDVFASVLAIGDAIGSVIKLAGMTVLAPFVIGFAIKNIVASPIVALLLSIYIALWNFIIVYKTITFITNRRGQK